MQLQPLLHLSLRAGTPTQTQGLAQGGIRLVPLIAGTFHSLDPQLTLQGSLVPGGADWQRVLPDGCLEIDARYLLRSNQQELIEVQSTGIRHGQGDHSYFRTFIRLRTDAPRLLQLNTQLALSTGQRTDQGVVLDFYRVT